MLNPQPILQWNPVEGATFYRVEVDNGSMETIWTVEVTETSVRYNGSQPLEPGDKYWLRIQTNTGADSLNANFEVSTHFSLLEPEQAQLVRDREQEIRQQYLNPVAQELAVANLYWDHDLKMEALEKWETLAKTNLQNSSLYLHLGDSYLRQDLVPESQVYYRQAIATVNPQNLEEQTTIQYRIGYTSAILGNREEAMAWLIVAKQGYEQLEALQQVEDIDRLLQPLSP